MHLAIWMTGALASFCILAVGARELSGTLSISQSLTIRSAIGVVFLSFVYLFKYRVINKQSIKIPRKIIFLNKIKLHFFRNIFHYTAQYGWFFGIGLLPLAEVFALEFTVPIWTLVIAALFLGEKVTKAKLISIFIGTLAVFVIVKPGYALVDPASLVVLASAIFFRCFSYTDQNLVIDRVTFHYFVFYVCNAISNRVSIISVFLGMA